MGVRRERLERLPGWSWERQRDRWDHGFERLVEFVHSEGHCVVPVEHQCPDGYRLGHWVRKQRSNTEGLTDDRLARLEAIAGWIWDVKTHQWSRAYELLRSYALQFGDARVPQDFRSADGFGLGLWVSHNRSRSAPHFPTTRPGCLRRLRVGPGTFSRRHGRRPIEFSWNTHLSMEIASSKQDSGHQMVSRWDHG